MVPIKSPLLNSVALISYIYLPPTFPNKEPKKTEALFTMDTLNNGVVNGKKVVSTRE